MNDPMTDEARRVKTGETFDIALSGAAGTGFRWEAEFSAAARQHVAIVARASSAASTVPGGPTVQTFRCRALKPGTVTLTFRQRRSWEAADSGTVQTIAVQIDPA